MSRGGSAAAKKIGKEAFGQYLLAGDLDSADYLAGEFAFLPEEVRGYAEAVCSRLDGTALKERIMGRYEL